MCPVIADRRALCTVQQPDLEKTRTSASVIHSLSEGERNNQFIKVSKSSLAGRESFKIQSSLAVQEVASTSRKEIDNLLENDESDEFYTSIVRKYPNLISPSGPLRKKFHYDIFTYLFKMTWGGKQNMATSILGYLCQKKEVSVDLKVVLIEVVNRVYPERDLKALTNALAYTDMESCENMSILKCRLHRCIAGLHYRNNDFDEADTHMVAALQKAHNISPDIDTVFAYRLKAIMLFEEYKKTRNGKLYLDSNHFFTKAMDHAWQQPETKRVITERIKVSKALFHLDAREEFEKEGKGPDCLTELQFRAQDTLQDVDEEYLTDGDKAFLYITRAKLFMCMRDWKEARKEAEKTLEMNQRCGLAEWTKQAERLLAEISNNIATSSSQ